MKRKERATKIVRVSVKKWFVPVSGAAVPDFGEVTLVGRAMAEQF